MMKPAVWKIPGVVQLKKKWRLY